jgi:hypothetical protein
MFAAQAVFSLASAGGVCCAGHFFAGIREAVFAAQAVFSRASASGVCCAGRFFAGIREAVFAAQALPVRACPLRGHPRGAYAARALPLCGAAPTFLCSGKEK